MNLKHKMKHKMKHANILLKFVPVIAAMILACSLIWWIHGSSGDHIRVGATYMTMNNPFYSVIDEELQLTIEGKGDILLTRDPALSQEKQNEQIHDLLHEDIDILVVNPVDFHEIKPALEEAKEKNVPVVVVDSQVDDTDLVACTIVSDNYGAGVLCAEHLMSIQDSAQIALIKHAEARSAVDRIQGFCDTIEGYDNYQIVGQVDSQGQLEIAMPAVSELLAREPLVNVVMALNDPSALGAMAALEECGMLNSTLVYGVDGSPEAKSMIAEHVMTATVAQSPIEIGKKTAQAIYQIINGEDYAKEITVPVQLITIENVSQFGTDGWQ